eukprot:jgi/Undpi1/3502/HiC_scaffold_16.g06874.m1
MSAEDRDANLRVVSLLPSLTEIVCAIGGGLEKHLVGVTHECDYPPAIVAGCERVTTSEINPHTMSQEEIDRRVRGSLSMGHSLYGLDEDRLKTADPTVVLTQALCDVCAPSFPMVLSTCARILGDDPKIISIEPGSVTEVIDSVRLVGKETGFLEEAEAEARRLEEGFDKIRQAVAEAETKTAASPPLALSKTDPDTPVVGVPKKPKVAFLEWLEPLFNGGHWIPDLLQAAGAHYTMAEAGKKSKRLSWQELVVYDADVVLIAPCGMDRKRAAVDGNRMWRHDWWRELRAVKDGKVYALDGNAYYARPGPRLLQGSGIIARILHGDTVGDAIGEEISPRDSWTTISGPPSSPTPPPPPSPPVSPLPTSSEPPPAEPTAPASAVSVASRPSPEVIVT